jgi:hypothetical protein
MIRALLAGTKFQTRRPLRVQPRPNGGAGLHRLAPYCNASGEWTWVLEATGHSAGAGFFSCPFGVPGDRLWVRETARVIEFADLDKVRVRYEADGAESDWLPFPERLKRPKVGQCIANGVHREGSRLTLEVTEVRVQRFSDISGEDARAEGCSGGHDSIPGYAFSATPREHFKHVIASIYGPDAWDSWCWAVTFRRVPSTPFSEVP